MAAFSHTPSSSRTNHQSTSFATAPNGPSSHPQLYPIPSVRAPLPAMVSHMKTSPPADTTQMSTLPSLPIPELHPSLTQPSTQYVHPTCLGTQLSSSKLYGNESRNEASLYYNYLNSNSHQLPQPVNNVYRLNGNYPGGMGSMQQEFARMVSFCTSCSSFTNFYRPILCFCALVSEITYRFLYFKSDSYLSFERRGFGVNQS